MSIFMNRKSVLIYPKDLIAEEKEKLLEFI